MNLADRPAGASFRRCALQVNPYEYSEVFRGQRIDGDARTHADAMIAKAVENDVSILAITDHNDASNVAIFRDAAAGTGITVFPGFEVASSEGIHILCIYPPDFGENQLGRFLGEFGIHSIGSSSELSDQSFTHILAGVRSQGGISIAAHVTHNKGLLKTLTGRARINAWQSEELLAIQIPGSIEELPMTYRQIVKNEVPQYSRPNPVSTGQAVAVVNANDVVSPEDLDQSGATCLVKMSEVSVEGLRQAFLDPDSRIRLNSDAEPETHSELLSIAWEGGFLDGACIRLNTNLNVLVGGRGTGKSTVIESVRYALGLEAIGREAARTHQGIVKQVLRGGTKISLRICSVRPAERNYLIERTVPNPPVVRDQSGQVSNLLPTEILPRVELYGQHEISELTKSREKLTRLLDRFVGTDQALDRRKADMRRDLQQTRGALLSAQREIADIEERLASLPAIEETLKRFEEAGLEDRLREQSLLVREERLLDSIPERLSAFRECLDTLRQELPIDRVFLSPSALEDLPGREILGAADEIIESLSLDLERAATLIEGALERAERGVGGIRSRWGERKREVESAYHRILRDLQRSAVDGAEFIRLRREIERLRPLRQRLPLLRQLEGEHIDRRRTLLAEWEDLKAEEFRRLDRAARNVSRKLSDRVQVEVTAAGNRDPLLQLLKDEIGGRLAEVNNRIKQQEIFSLPEFIEKCRSGTGALMRTYSIPLGQATNLAGASSEVLMRIEELELPPTTAIRLNTAPKGDRPHWQTLEELSTGQKATAVLLLLLLDSDAPLIVDQPEDDLDNRFITEGIVPRIREEKRKRQFVFSTHNANIPVLGDAELIIGLTARGEADEGRARIAPEHIGSIDAGPVRALVEDLLEGGKDAFEKRRLKYGF